MRMKKTICNILVAGLLGSMSLIGSAAPAAAHIQTPTDYCTLAPDVVVGLFDFRHACAHHDYAYRTHWTSKANGDTYFKWAMESECRNRHPWWSPSLYTCLKVKDGYHWAVKYFGGWAYNKRSVYASMDSTP